ncbi:MAG: sugar phosphate nucleotidyltransferase, partial [Candidatus Heimdallarchaeaceae archaeon]
MKAILLAAGEGLRLRPLTENVPKPLLKVLDKTILEKSINNLSKCGVKGFVIITNYKEEKIKKHILDKFPSLDIVFVHQPEIKGTGNAFLLAKDHIQEEFFIGVNGDCLYSVSLIKQTVEAAKNNTVSVGGKLVSDPESYGIILIDENSSPQEIKEKPAQTEIKEGYANIGLYSVS